MGAKNISRMVQKIDHWISGSLLEGLWAAKESPARSKTRGAERGGPLSSRAVFGKWRKRASKPLGAPKGLVGFLWVI